jgi:hypothetical protein
MAVSPPPSQYINVEPEEEGMPVYTGSGEGDMTIRASQSADILRALKLYQ